jgi:hypothetical protein
MTNKIIRIYKVRRVSDGLFSKGGDTPSFGPKGKVWAGPGPLKNHFNLLSSLGRVIYKDCEVVEYELVESETSATSAISWIADSDRREQERHQEQERRRLAWIEEKEKKELARLASKYKVTLKKEGK